MSTNAASTLRAITRAMLLSIFLIISAQITGADEVGPRQSLSGPSIKHDRIDVSQNDVVVKLGGQFDPAQLSADSLPFTVVDSLSHSSTYLLRTESGMRFEAVDSVLSILGEVFLAQPNYPLNKLHPVQGSYPFSDLQHVGNFKQQLAANLLDLSDCHSLVDGSGSKVAVIDAGINFNHPGLEGAALSGYDFIDNDTYAFDEPGGIVSGHGTFVAGVVHLVAPEAQIVSYRVADAAGEGEGFSLAKAIERAVDDGCDVINISLVLTEEHLAVKDAIAYAVSQGVLVVAAAGNGSDQFPVFPAADPNAVGVAAIDSLLVLADYSSYGSAVDICAPGSWIYSPYQGDLYAWWSGTSFAAPFVSGEAALLIQRAPYINLAGLRSAIISTGINLNPQNPGKEGLMGHGLVNPLGAILAVDSSGADMCDIPGDINNNGISYEIADMVLLDSAVSSGNQSFLGSKIGNADLDGDCHIDSSDQGLMHYIVTGQGVPVITECSACSSYVLIPDTSGSSLDSAVIIPEELVFRVNPGNWDTLVSSVLLISTNAPAAYHLMNTWTTDFASTPDTAGFTPDSLKIYVTPFGRGAGVWGDDFYYAVSGIRKYAWLHVTLIVSSDSNEQCDLPGDVNANGIPYEYADLDALDSAIATGNANYLGPKIGNSDLTGDCYINAADLNLLRLAVMGDTMPFLQCAPCSSYIFLSDTIINPDSDSAYAYAIPGGFYAPAGAELSQRGNLMVGATGGAKLFFVYNLDSPEFVSIMDSVGWTNDSIGFEVHSTSSMPPGIYVDTLIIQVDSVINSPLLSVIYLMIDSTPVSGDSAWVYSTPGSVFTAPPGEDHVQGGRLVVGALGPSKPFSVQFLDASDFLQLGANQGFTNDSISFNIISTANMPPGVYADSLIIYVDSVINSPLRHAVFLYITDDSAGVTDSALAIPHEMTLQIPYGNSDSLYRSVLLYSSNAPAAYSAFVAGGTESFIFLPNPNGTTNDSLEFMVFPAGLSPGWYSDSVIINVSGCNIPASVVVHLQILGADSSFTLLDINNYPNPFNPTTEVVYSLPFNSEVSLKVFDLLGREVITLVKGYRPAGIHRVTWNGEDEQGNRVSSGVYFYRLQTNIQSLTRKMLLLR
jgi:Subtilase family/FlgD Ig-like domain